MEIPPMLFLILILIPDTVEVLLLTFDIKHAHMLAFHPLGKLIICLKTLAPSLVKFGHPFLVILFKLAPDHIASDALVKILRYAGDLLNPVDDDAMSLVIGPCGLVKLTNLLMSLVYT
jgi:hypothetical protein